MKIKFFIVFFLSLLLNTVFADNLIRKINIKGNDRTSENVILKEGELKEGRSYTDAEIEEARVRILNLEIFSEVDFSFNKGQLNIKVVERWTTIPILKFASGGGVSEVIAGVYDVNLFGKFVEAGGQYQRLGEKHSGVVWTKFPRLTDKLQLDLQAWKTSRVRIKYRQYDDDAIVTNGFTQTRDKIYAGLNYRETYESIFGVFYEYNKDKFENDLTFDNFSNNDVVLPVSTEYHLLGAQYIKGRIDIEREFYEGERFTGMFRLAFSGSGGESFQELSLRYENFKRFGDKLNLALRSTFGGNTNSENIQYRLYFGGLETIRGFKDNRFSGNSGFTTNLELRHSTLQKSKFTIQTVAFTDFVSTSDKFSDMFKNNAMSVGAGVRVFLPDFYRFVVRVDLAKPISKNDDELVNFGVQQFF